MFTLNCKGKLLSLNSPAIMGIINTTPDSFYFGNRKPLISQAIHTAGTMLENGAVMIDIGAQSTRPGSVWLSADEELERLLPVLIEIRKAFPSLIISVDTFYAKVAEEAIRNGADIINDVSGGNLDTEMIQTVGAFGNIPFVCMHMKGTPQNMTKLAKYDHMMEEILDYFIQKKEACRQAGIHDIVIDPGFGFAKNLHQNYELLRLFSDFQILQCPILVGISRKGMITRPLHIAAEKALNGTSILNTIALLNGANILRVHDVTEAIEAVKLVELYQGKELMK